MDDKAPVAHFGLRLLPERAERVLQLRQILADLLAGARPGIVVVFDLRQRLLDAARQRERRVDRPETGKVRRLGLKKSDRQQAGFGELLEARDRLGASFGAVL